MKFMSEVPRMSEPDIKEMVSKLVKNQMFCATMIPPEEQEHMISSVFMPVALGGLGEYDPASIGNIVEDMSKANNMAVNGYPTFFSCRLVHKEPRCPEHRMQRIC